jgi:CBS domain-containing protein
MFHLKIKVMKVKDLMTAESLQSCSLDTKLHKAAKMMQDANHGSLPVVDNNNKVLAMLTDRDICLSLASKSDKTATQLSVKDAITNMAVHSVRPEDTVTQALKEMRKNKIGRLAVTDREGKLKGILSVNRILSHAIAKKEQLGNPDSTEENLAKTLNALIERNSKELKKIREVELEAGDE